MVTNVLAVILMMIFLRFTKNTAMNLWSLGKGYDAYDAAKYVTESYVDGDIVECGVWRGGVSALMKDVICKREVGDNRSFGYLIRLKECLIQQNLIIKGKRSKRHAHKV